MVNTGGGRREDSYAGKERSEHDSKLSAFRWQRISTEIPGGRKGLGER